MAKKAAKVAAAKDAPGKAENSSKKMSKIEAVRQICKLYPKAKPKELAPLLLEKFGVELTPQRISMARVHLRKQAGKPSKRGKLAGRNAGGREMTISQLVAAQRAIKELGGEAKVQEMLQQISAAKKLLANA